MAEFEDKLNAILSNPTLMGQIMSMAGSMGQSQPSPPPPPPPRPSGPAGAMPCPDSGPGGLDPGALMGMMELLRSTQIDQREQNLIRALECYLPRDRLEKLKRAMQASKIARFAASSMKQGR